MTTSTSSVKKSVKKDTKAMEDRMARFDVKAVFPGRRKACSGQTVMFLSTTIPDPHVCLCSTFA